MSLRSFISFSIVATPALIVIKIFCPSSISISSLAISFLILSDISKAFSKSVLRRNKINSSPPNLNIRSLFLTQFFNFCTKNLRTISPEICPYLSLIFFKIIYINQYNAKFYSFSYKILHFLLANFI